MGVKSKVSVNDLLNAQSKWHNDGKMKGGYDCVSSGALICDAGPELLANLRSLPFKVEYSEPSPKSEVLIGRDTKVDVHTYHYRVHANKLAGRELTRKEAHTKSCAIRKARNARRRANLKARTLAHGVV